MTWTKQQRQNLERLIRDPEARTEEILDALPDPVLDELLQPPGQEDWLEELPTRHHQPRPWTDSRPPFKLAR